MEELENRYELARLMSRLISGIATSEEERRLQEWCESSEEHKKEYETVCKRLAVDLREEERLDVDKAWEKLQYKLPRKRRSVIAWYAVAACAAIVLFVGVLWFYAPIREAGNTQPLANERGTKAVLILDNGKRIDLEQKQEQFIGKTSGTRIAVEENVLSYRTEERQQEEKPVFNTVEVPRGGEYRLELSDGTKVWMNAESRLTYPVRFAGNMREVSMEGEICFEVAARKEQPFVVKVGNVDVRVLGTLFNVEAYPENETVQTTLVHGKVEVATERQKLVLIPDEQAVVDQEGEIIIKKVLAKEYIAWTKGEFQFTRMGLDEIMQKLARWYDVEVFFANPALKEARFSLSLKRYEEIGDVLSKIEKTGRVHFRMQDQCIVVE